MKGAQDYLEYGQEKCKIGPALNSFIGFGDGKVVRDWGNAHCFAPLRHNHTGGCEYLYSNTRPNIHSEQNLDEEILLTYLDYLLNRSPFARSFPFKDVEMTSKYKGNLIECGNDLANYVVIAAIALRYPWEYHRMLESWYHLRDNMSEDDAFYFMHLIKWSPKEKDFRYGYQVYGHAIFDGQMGMHAAQLDNFRKGKMGVGGKSYNELFVHNTYYYDLGNYFGKGNGDRILFPEGHDIDKLWVAPRHMNEPNPFVRPKKKRVLPNEKPVIIQFFDDNNFDYKWREAA